MPTSVRKTVLNPRRKIVCTRAQMVRKSPDVQFGIRFSVWNVGSMSEKWDEIFETLKKRCVHICFLQAVKWKGQGQGGEGFKAENGVGVIAVSDMGGFGGVHGGFAIGK